MRKTLSLNARRLRNHGTEAERVLWQHLRCSQLEGAKFRRQEPIEGYIVDFVSFNNRLAIELDGGQHAFNIAYDQKRDQCLRRNGFLVLRFWDNDVMRDVDTVLEKIRISLRGTLPHPLPPPARGGGT
jgi:very-short-patch-repair endonuclease